MFDRRSVLKIGAFTGTAAALSAIPAASATGETAPKSAARKRPASAVEPFTVRMPLLRTLRPSMKLAGSDVYRLTAQAGTEQILPGVATPVLGYNGSYIGPTIRARAGRPVMVLHQNALSEPVSLHLHGGHTPAVSDGHPMNSIDPGGSRLYDYPNGQQGATLWYHDHAHHVSAEHVFRGMHGFYLLESDDEKQLQLPSGAYDVPIMLTDSRFADDGSMVFEMDDFTNRNTVLVNGRPQPYLPVEARRYRLRLGNASNMRFFILALNGGDPMTQIASDGGLLPAPVPVTSLIISPAERAEIVVDFSRYPVGSQIVLADALSATPVMQFRVGAAGADDSQVPDVLRPVTQLGASSTTRQISMGMNPATGKMSMDGKLFDMDRVDQTVKLGSTETWKITNTDTELNVTHNIHVHMVQFRVTGRTAGALAGEDGWKDTAIVRPGETVTLQMKFSDYTGRFLYHCHLLDHSAMGMMAQFEVVR